MRELLAWSAILVCPLLCLAQINVLVEEDDPSLVFSPEKSSWSPNFNPQPGPNGSSVTSYYHSGGYISNSHAGASITLTFNGSYVAYISDLYYTHGLMQVELDGATTTLSTYSPLSYGTPQVKLFEAHVDPNTPGHMIKLTNLENNTMGFDYLLFTAVLPTPPTNPSSSSSVALSSSFTTSSSSSTPTLSSSTSPEASSTSTLSTSTSASLSSTLTASRFSLTPSSTKPTPSSSTPVSSSSPPVSSSSPPVSSSATSSVSRPISSPLSSTPTSIAFHPTTSADHSETATATPHVSVHPTLSLASLSVQNSQTAESFGSDIQSSPAAVTTRSRLSASLTAQSAKAPSAPAVSQAQETPRPDSDSSPTTSTSRDRLSSSTDQVDSQPKHHSSPPSSTTIIMISVATTLTIVAAAVLGVVCLRRRRRKADDRDATAPDAMGEADQRLLVPAPSGADSEGDVDPRPPRLAITIPGADLKARRSVAPILSAFRSETSSASSARGTASSYYPLTNEGVIAPSYV